MPLMAAPTIDPTDGAQKRAPQGRGERPLRPCATACPTAASRVMTDAFRHVLSSAVELGSAVTQDLRGQDRLSRRGGAVTHHSSTNISCIRGKLAERLGASQVVCEKAPGTDAKVERLVSRCRLVGSTAAIDSNHSIRDKSSAYWPSPPSN